MKKRLLALCLLLILIFTRTISQAQPCTVTTGSVITTGLTYCTGDFIAVPWTKSGICGAASEKLFLSDAAGSFVTEIDITTGPDGTSPATGIIPLTVPAGNTYRIRVKYGTTISSNDNGQDITIYSSPTLSVTPINSSVCAGTSVTLTASGNATTYTWAPPIGLSSTVGASVNANPSATTDYSVTSNNGTCSSTDVVRITYLGTLPTLIHHPDTAICAGKTLSYKVGYLADQYSYSWEPDLENSAALSTFGVVYVLGVPTVSGEYHFIVSKGSCSSTDTLNITLNSLPNVYAGEDLTVLSGQATHLTAMGASSYSWSPTSFLSSSEGSDVVFTAPSSPGNYSYVVNGMDVQGCDGQDTVVVTVTSNSITAVHLIDKEENPLMVYPNPYKGVAHIVFSTATASNIQLDVYNLLGQKVQILVNEKLSVGEHRYSFAAKQIEQPSGIYFVKLILDNQIYMKRIMELE